MSDDLPALRYFCQVTPKKSKGKRTFADMGFSYFEAFQAAGFPIRVIESRRSKRIVDFGDPKSRWHPYANYFTTELPSSYVNVICGSNGELVGLFTIGVKNVAITAPFAGLPTVKEAIALSDYDAVICPTKEDAIELSMANVVVREVWPLDDLVERLIRRL